MIKKISEIHSKKFTINCDAKAALQDFLDFQKEKLDDKKLQVSDILNHYLIELPKKIDLAKVEVKTESLNAKITQEALETLEKLAKENSVSDSYVIEKIVESISNESNFKKWKKDSKSKSKADIKAEAKPEKQK